MASGVSQALGRGKEMWLSFAVSEAVFTRPVSHLIAKVFSEVTRAGGAKKIVAEKRSGVSPGTGQLFNEYWRHAC